MMATRFSLLGAALLVAACSPESDTVPPATLGESVRHNMAVHVLPIPVAPGNAQYEMPGRRADVQMERYLTGKVKPPVVGSAQSSLPTGNP